MAISPATVEIPSARFNNPSEVEGSAEEKLAAFRHTSDDIRKGLLDYFSKSVE